MFGVPGHKSGTPSSLSRSKPTTGGTGRGDPHASSLPTPMPIPPTGYDGEVCRRWDHNAGPVRVPRGSVLCFGAEIGQGTLGPTPGTLGTTPSTPGATPRTLRTTPSTLGTSPRRLRMQRTWAGSEYRSLGWGPGPGPVVRAPNGREGGVAGSTEWVLTTDYVAWVAGLLGWVPWLTLYVRVSLTPFGVVFREGAGADRAIP